MWVEVAQNDFLEDVFEEIDLVVAGDELLNGAAELLVLSGREVAHGRKGEVNERQLSMVSDGGDLGPEAKGFLGNGRGSGGGEFVELFAADWFGIAQEQGVDERAGAKRIAGGGAEAVRDGIAELLGVTEMSGGGGTDSRGDGMLWNNEPLTPALSPSDGERGRRRLAGDGRDAGKHIKERRGCRFVLELG